MGFFDDLQHSVNKGMEAASRTGQQAKLSLERSNLESQREDLYAQLGKGLYDVVCANGELRAGREPLLDGIASLNEQIADVARRIDALAQPAPATAPAAARTPGTPAVASTSAAPGTPAPAGITTCFCSVCGARVSTSDRFCQVCGTPMTQILEAAGVVVAEPAPQPTPVAQPEPEPAPQPEAEAAPATVTCPGCGAAIDPGDRFCAYCGTRIL